MSKKILYNISYKNDDKEIFIRKFYKPNTLTIMKQNLRSLIDKVEEMYDCKLTKEEITDTSYKGEINGKKVTLKLYKNE